MPVEPVCDERPWRDEELPDDMSLLCGEPVVESVLSVVVLVVVVFLCFLCFFFVALLLDDVPVPAVSLVEEPLIEPLPVPVELLPAVPVPPELPIPELPVLPVEPELPLPCVLEPVVLSVERVVLVSVEVALLSLAAPVSLPVEPVVEPLPLEPMLLPVELLPVSLLDPLPVELPVVPPLLVVELPDPALPPPPCP